MKIGLVGPSYQQASLPFDAQRTINLYPVIDESGSDVASLYATPGCKLFSEVGFGPQRKGFSAANKRAFCVSGSGVYEIFANGNSILRGSIDQSQGNLTMAENGFQLALCDGRSLYILNYDTNEFKKVVTSALPPVQSVCFLDGFFVVNEVNSGRFFVSGLYDGLSWDALDFATAESSPDLTLRVMNVSGQLWLFGEKTIEIWANNGSSFFPFSRVGGSTMNVGLVGVYAALEIDNTAIWVGQDDEGFGILYRANGFSPSRISTEPLEIRIQEAPNPETFRCFSYQEQGHSFFILSGGGMETAIAYDISTQLTHERAYLNDNGKYELPLPVDCIFAFNKQLTFDRKSNKVYEQSSKFFSDNGDEIARERIFTHLTNENIRFKYNNLTIGFEAGVGNSDDEDPKAVLSWSDDGGKTWGNWREATIGKAGYYARRAIWRRLGLSRIRTFRVRITAKVKVAITGAYLNT